MATGGYMFDVNTLMLACALFWCSLEPDGSREAGYWLHNLSLCFKCLMSGSDQFGCEDICVGLRHAESLQVQSTPIYIYIYVYVYR